MKCTECGNSLEPDFNYCPECGIEIDRTEQFKQVIDESFSKLEDVVRGDTMLRLENLSNRLDSMEEELESFMLSAHSGT